MKTENEYHVSIKGNDSNCGGEEKPLRTIMAAAMLAQLVFRVCPL